MPIVAKVMLRKYGLENEPHPDLYFWNCIEGLLRDPDRPHWRDMA